VSGRKSQFDAEMVQMIRWLSDQGESDQTLADALEISTGGVYAIRKRITHRWVPEGVPAEYRIDHAIRVDRPVFAAEQQRRRAAQLARRARLQFERAAAGGLP
jgi:hypothetical protein